MAFFFLLKPIFVAIFCNHIIHSSQINMNINTWVIHQIDCFKVTLVFGFIEAKTLLNARIPLSPAVYTLFSP